VGETWEPRDWEVPSEGHHESPSEVPESEPMTEGQSCKELGIYCPWV